LIVWNSVCFLFFANPMLIFVPVLTHDLNPWSILLLWFFLNALMLFLIISFVSKFRFTMLYVMCALVSVIVIFALGVFGVIMLSAFGGNLAG